MAASLRAMLALAALLAVAATAAANGGNNFLPYNAPCAGGACSALAALDEIKKCRSDGCSNAKCTTATNNLCTLVKGASAGCDLATRTEVNTKDQLLLGFINTLITRFYAQSNTIYRFTTQSAGVTGTNVVVIATCNAGEIAIGGYCPDVDATSTCTGCSASFTLSRGPYALASGSNFSPIVNGQATRYDCLYDVTIGTGTVTLGAWVLCATVQPQSLLAPLVGPSCNSAPFNPFKK